MKIIFTTPINEDDVLRNSLTVDHLIIYPDKEIVLNTRYGISQIVPMSTMGEDLLRSLASFLGFFGQEAKAKYEAKTKVVDPEEVVSGASYIDTKDKEFDIGNKK